MAAIQLSKIRPNPFRQIDKYPICRDKVDALRRSFKKTGFWGNIVARERNGFFEIAYGHHRLVALKEEKVAEVDLIIKKLTNDDMIRIMASENMTAWGTSAGVIQETIRSVVEAYGKGIIELPAPKTRSSHLRHAPSFQPANKASLAGPARLRSYSTATIAEFLGWDSRKQTGTSRRSIERSLQSLELVERKALDDDALIDLNPHQAQSLTEQVAGTYKEAIDEDLTEREAASLAKKVGKEIKKKYFSEERQQHDARTTAVLTRSRVTKALPEINRFARTLANYVHRLLLEDGESEKFNALIKYKKGLLPDPKRIIADELKGLSERALKLRGEFL